MVDGRELSEKSFRVRPGSLELEPFFFERKAQRPDGSETRVAFTLAFARDSLALEASFFVSRSPPMWLISGWITSAA